MLTDFISPGQSGPGSNRSEQVHLSSQNCNLTIQFSVIPGHFFFVMEGRGLTPLQ